MTALQCVCVGFRFQDYTDLAIPAFLSRFDPELGRSGEHVIFVENAVSGVVEPREAASHAGAAVEEDEADEDSRLLGRMDGSFPGEEDPLFGWGSSVGPREGRDGNHIAAASLSRWSL